ncbi:MAG TPA: two-component regulator propeller domain-containing protein [Ignavibacteria bacterium]|nr:two-component regulator propeller domain-containing protein [Ignavibacteria bacterium]
MKFEKISLEQGLSQSAVAAISQDAKGFMWFGTQQGLNRYDGYKIKTYLNNTGDPLSLKYNTVHTLFGDRMKNLWVGSFSNIVSRYDISEDGFNNIETGDKKNLRESGITISSITEDSRNNLWIGTLGNGLLKLNISSGKVSQLRKIENEENSLASDSVLSIYSDESDNIWTGTWESGISVFNQRTKCFRNIRVSKKCDSGKSDRIYNIFRDSRGNLLFSTGSGLKVFDEKSELLKDDRHYTGDTGVLKSEIIRTVCEDKNNNLWYGTKNHGIYLKDFSSGNIQNFRTDNSDIHSVSDNNILSLYNDSSNVLWTGTFTGGVCRSDCGQKKFFLVKGIADSKSKHFSDKITAFLTDKKDNLWIGTYGDGLYRYESKSGFTENYSAGSADNNSFKGSSVFCFCKVNDEDIWIGVSSEGINKYSFTDLSFRNFKIPDNVYNEVSCIIDFSAFEKNEILIGTTGSGIYRFNTVKNKFIPLLKENASAQEIIPVAVKCMHIDSEGYLWAGTIDQGLFRADIKKNKLKLYRSDSGTGSGISDNYITVILEDRKKNLWFGTRNGGLNKYDRHNDSFSHYDTSSGIPNNMINGLTEDDCGCLWISTNKGLSRFDADKEIFRNYDTDDGLQNNEFNEYAYYRADDGTHYFGGVKGYNYFKPEDIIDNPYVPEIAVTDFQIFNHSVNNSPENKFLKKNISVTENIVISYRESVFSFEFASLIYNNPARNQYAYMMEGFDKEWIYCGTRRFATYTNLEPGDYTFRVKGSNNDGVWNEQGTSVKINITPPFWKTWWFRSLGVMSVIGATGLAYQQKLSKIENDKKSQEDFSRRLIDSQEQERKRIASELHDTIAHDILITKNKAVLGLKKAEDSKAVKEILNEISDLSSATLNDVRTISYDLHPHQIERLGITKAIRSIINNVGKSSEIEFTCNTESIDNILSKELEMNLFRIIQECTSNIIKHSGAAEASLNIIKDNKTLTVTIWDNGKGISKNRTEGLGLKGISERIRLYNGELVIESVPAKGTLIAISLPIKTDNHEYKK